MPAIPIVVITPVKNESWILDIFLRATSMFADHIIIADQFSTDESRDIAGRFEKVVLIQNDREKYDEQYRQKLLIDKAREIVPGKKILLALDADEILTPDSLGSKDWERMCLLDAGTVIRFEKPDLLANMRTCIRHKEYFTLGYVDDGVDHSGKKIHSVRIPRLDTSPEVDIDSIKFMHLALTRPHEYAARQRYYSMVENIEAISPFYRRLIKYSPRLVNYISQREITSTPESWIAGWIKEGIDLAAIKSYELNNFNDMVLRNLVTYGPAKFYFDDIWQINWKEYNKNRNLINPEPQSLRTPLFARVLLSALVYCIKLLKS